MTRAACHEIYNYILVMFLLQLLGKIHFAAPERRAEYPGCAAHPYSRRGDWYQIQGLSPSRACWEFPVICSI